MHLAVSLTHLYFKEDTQTNICFKRYISNKKNSITLCMFTNYSDE